MASSLTTSRPTSTCLSYHQHNVQVQVLCAARKSARQCSWQQTAITATSRSTNDTAAVRTTRQRQYGLRQQLIVPFARRTVTVSRAFGESSGSSKDPSLQDYVEVKIESVKVNQGSSIVYLRVVNEDGGVIPVHIGDNESNALLREINKQRQARPLTHDLMKNMVVQLGYKVTKVRVTDIIANTYYARIHVARTSSSGETDEVDIDARPSDAINLAVRFGAPVYVSKRIAEQATPATQEQYQPTNETHADIVRSVRETLSNYEDPTIMYQLQKELAVKEERFEDAQQFQEHIVHEMTHNRLLRLVVAMESALADGRYEEAAHLRDEYRKVVQQQQSTQAPADR